jgi:hypothetical protein
MKANTSVYIFQIHFAKIIIRFNQFASIIKKNIQDIGMWKSDVYLRYIEKGLPGKSKALQKFGEALPQFTM